MLQRVVLKGFKSIKAMDLELRRLNVLIGANGAGKSNFVSFLKMLNSMVTGPTGGLQSYIAAAGQAHSLLHYGPKQTLQIQSLLEFTIASTAESVLYRQQLSYVPLDRLVFDEEYLEVTKGQYDRRIDILGVQPGFAPQGGFETRVIERANQGDPIAKVVYQLLNECRVFHFHDTSATARIKRGWYVGDNSRLHADAGNLAPFLLRLSKENGGSAYRRIVSTIGLVAPFFSDFDLTPNGRDVFLNWREKGSDQVFGPHQLSDGTLRAICLIALLMQPEESLPELIVVDEPELGLHPYALSVVASLFKKASHHAQVLVSTQSSSFLDNFDPEDVIVVDREGKESLFTRPDPTKLDAWLEDYSLGEVWEKNVIGGGPH